MHFGWENQSSLAAYLLSVLGGFRVQIELKKNVLLKVDLHAYGGW